MTWALVVVFMTGNFVTLTLVPEHDEKSCRQLAKEMHQERPPEVKSVSCVKKGKML